MKHCLNQYRSPKSYREYRSKILGKSIQFENCEIKIISRKLDDKKGKSITGFAYQAAALLSINKKNKRLYYIVVLLGGMDG